ncbi:ATP-binding protein [Streptomyces hirsutus]|uniref:ATP-binding protein n=1 Tax=Streptomyces hirsutus TaxID=35620 RepID=UPI00342F8A25
MSENEPWEYSLHIPNDLRAVTISRRTLRLILTMHGLIGLVDVAELLAAELVSNAVRHTKGPAALRVRWSPPGTLRIGAWDADPEPPEPPVPFEREEWESGRGLALVRACADVGGWQPLTREGDRGKYVWCELAALLQTA